MQAEDLRGVIYAVVDASRRQVLADRASQYAAAMKEGGADRADDLLLLNVDFYEGRVGMRFTDAAQWMQVVSTVIIACRAATSRPTAHPGITLLSMQLLAWPTMLDSMCRMILVALVPPRQSTGRPGPGGTAAEYF